MAEEPHDAEIPKEPATEAAADIESQIKDAMLSRFTHFKEQADSLTFEGVRRLLEKDLGLETYALDVHKRFVKKCLLECLEGPAGDHASKSSDEMGKKGISTKMEALDSPEEHQSKKEVKEAYSEDEAKMEDSPVLGLLTGKKTTKKESSETEQEEHKIVSESAIKKAIRNRASYVRANSDKVTMAGLRRLLEEDLKLDNRTLDGYKKFIADQLEDVLNSSEVSAPASEAKKKNLKKNSQVKPSIRASSEESSDSLENESEEEVEVRPKRKTTPKGKQTSEVVKKRKRPEKETKAPSNKRIKPAETVSNDDGDAEDSGVSEDSRSESSAAKAVKRKEASTPAYGKRVEHLKSVIKSCGMSVPPAIYKKVKQVPENKREAQLINELEKILSKEGLSPNPSEKDIKEVRKKKQRAKELEGIDMSNIVSSTRRRATTSFVAPPKPKIPDESDADDSEESDDSEDSDDEDVANEDEDGGDEVNEDSQSEDSNEDEDEESD